jgi:RNA polymerase sigma-70 factor (ECF subfamily)
MREDPAASDLDAFVRGDEAAFERIFRGFQADVFAWIVRIVRNREAAEEVTLDAFWRAYRGRARFDAARSFGAWMRRIATNAALDHLRANRSNRASDVDIGHIAAPPGADPEVARSIGRALSRLSPKLRIVATLALIEQRPYSEIADALDVPVGTIKSRVSRASARLQDELTRMGIRP